MNLLSDIFGDEVSDFKNLVKVTNSSFYNYNYYDEFPISHRSLQPEEEINKYSTQDDMGEVKRSIFILKKGYQSQKQSV